MSNYKDKALDVHLLSNLLRESDAILSRFESIKEELKTFEENEEEIPKEYIVSFYEAMCKQCYSLHEHCQQIIKNWNRE